MFKQCLFILRNHLTMSTCQLAIFLDFLLITFSFFLLFLTFCGRPIVFTSWTIWSRDGRAILFNWHASIRHWASIVIRSTATIFICRTTNNWTGNWAFISIFSHLTFHGYTGIRHWTPIVIKTSWTHHFIR